MGEKEWTRAWARQYSQIASCLITKKFKDTVSEPAALSSVHCSFSVNASSKHMSALLRRHARKCPCCDQFTFSQLIVNTDYSSETSLTCLSMCGEARRQAPNLTDVGYWSWPSWFACPACGHSLEHHNRDTTNTQIIHTQDTPKTNPRQTHTTHPKPSQYATKTHI